MSKKVAEYTVRPLSFDAALVKKVMARRKKGDSLSAIAKDFKVTAGKAAMAELVANTERVNIEDQAQLAKAIVKDRQARCSWGLVAARYGITEGTARAAYEAAAGEPFGSLDFRRRSVA